MAEAGPLMDLMEAQHRDVVRLVSDSEASLAAWRAGEGGAQNQLAVQLDALSVTLEPHLADEETNVLPLCAQALTIEEWGALPGHALDGAVPLPFGLLPAAVALQIIPLEYGFHRNDLDWALGTRVPLTDDIASTLLAITPGLLPMLAAGTPVNAAGIPPGAPISFRLTAPATRLLARYEAGQWSIGPDNGLAPVTCEISGNDSSLALLIMGRIDPSPPAVTVTSTDAARAFKKYFPGP